ncbi:BREX system serine/threonine kinase PglW [Nocardia sp. NBC_00881]|uniref:BREX system serine/threonine kinase PglW n=1 Tax=Nocardia sp. NBC_00881 TaxID=2975995 RepID=UPI0038656166|nr:BREX system serine/threonine kinase PglW [Nocardia sp. NBC_00881]
MREDSLRWEQINPSAFAHERDGLHELAKYLPDEDPFHVWPNVEFVATDGSINEVDALVLIPRGLFVVELKHWQGDLMGDGIQWVRRMPKGRLVPVDNPYILANRKAKRLASLINFYARKAGKQTRSPFVGAAVFMHAHNMVSSLDEIGRQHTFGLDGGTSNLPSFKEFLLDRPANAQLINTKRGREIVDLVRGAKIRPSVADRRIGQLILHPKPFAEGIGWQDFLAGHAMDTALVRRVRFYLTSRADEEELPVIKRAAEREFRLLQGIHHPGIAHPVDLVDHAFGPAVIFDHTLESQRLDSWLNQRQNQTLAQKLQLIQDLAEIVDYAHSRRLSHRALHPNAVFVTEKERAHPALVITDWQTGGRLAGSTQLTKLGSSSNGAGLELFFDDEVRRFQAPEFVTNAHVPGVQLDVFALGAIAYRIFAGVAPAENAEQLVAAVTNQGLNLAAVVDGMPAGLVDLIYDATHGDPKQRLSSVRDFLRGLDAVWDELTAPEPEPVTDPLEAKKGDLLDGGLTVVRRLGSGSTAVALLVNRNGRELVLKVARDEQHSQRLEAEASVLGKLKHWQVAALIEGPVTVGGRTALLLESAGPRTVVEELQEGRLALDLLERYGRDLFDIVDFLDGQGVWHRDIKPANLAARPRPKDKQLHLCAFDFSLAAVPATQLNAGTPTYLDPFLGGPRRKVYDAAAERFAVAVTLYEMATGALPRWGENANPAAVTDEVTLEPSAFDPAVADRMVTFFARALSRDVAKRFDTVEEMADAWREIFRAIPDTKPDPSKVGPVTAELTRTSPLEATELTARARSALERLGVHTVGELLDYEPSALTRARGVPNATRKEILDQTRALRVRLEPVRETLPETAAEEQVPHGIEAVCATLLPNRTSRNAKEWTAMQVVLGQATTENGVFLRWPSQAEAARATDQSQPQISIWLRKYVKKWVGSTALMQIRDEIVALLDARGAVMSAAELAEALAAARGSYTSGPARLPQAIGLVRAAIEAELSTGGDSRVAIRRFRSSDTVLVGREPDDPAAVTTAADLLQFAVSLGQCATRLCISDPLPSRQRAVDELRGIAPPDGMPTLSDQRLLQLAAVSSNAEASVSAQGQLYPVGMPAERALKLSAGALFGKRMAVEEVRGRVHARFPDAEPLPGRPALDKLLEQCGLRWDSDAQAYAPPTLQSSVTATRMPTTLGRLTGPTEVAKVDTALAAVIDRRGFLAVLARLSALDHARRALLARHNLTEVNITAITLDQLRALGYPWEAIVAADNGEAGNADFRGLTELVQHHVLPAIAEQLETEAPVLITEAAPLARYGQLQLLQQLADPTRPRPAARLLLVPARRPEPAMLDQVQLPLTSPSTQSLWLPQEWIEPTAERAAR